MKRYQFVYHDKQRDRFSIYLCEHSGLNFIYWKELAKHNISRVRGNEAFLAKITQPYAESRAAHLHEIQLLLNSEPDLAEKDLDEPEIEPTTMSAIDVLSLLLDNSETPLIITNTKIIGNLEISSRTIKKEIAFFGCVFEGNFILRSCVTQESIWLSNSCFKKQFSLKNSACAKSVHLEGADFTGEGGASFRGLTAINLYLDLDIKGCNDMIWINEVNILNEVSIGGRLTSDIQILGQQDLEPSAVPLRKGYIGKLNIGKILYKSEASNITFMEKGKIIIKDMRIGNGITLNNIEAQQISIGTPETPYIHLKNTTVISDLSIDHCHIYRNISNSPSSILECSIGRFLKIEDTILETSLSLVGTTVDNTSIFRNNTFGSLSELNIFKFITERMIFFPEESLYGEKNFSLMKPAKLNRIKHLANKEDMGEIYSNLKNWFSHSGRLKLEDVSYFHLRDCYSKLRVERFILGTIFGWGVRLRNIVLSSLGVIVAFGLFYWTSYNGITSLFQAFLLSAQSFISSFFGEWHNTLKENIDSAGLVTTVESYIGVLFITVLVGSYIRKLLR
jgi:hypothetical protein